MEQSRKLEDYVANSASDAKESYLRYTFFGYKLTETDIPIRVGLKSISKFYKFAADNNYGLLFSSEREEGLADKNLPSQTLLVWLYRKTTAASKLELNLIPLREHLTAREILVETEVSA